MRVIPNRLYNDLLSRSLIGGESFFPSESDKSPSTQVLTLINPTLQAKGEKILKSLQLSATKNKNELSIQNQTFTFTGLAHLIERFILEDPTLLKEEKAKKFLHTLQILKFNSALFQQNTPPSSTSQTKWINFDHSCSFVT